MARNPADPLAATASLGEEAAIGRIEKALFGGDERPVQVGRYEIKELIGSGAFGKVYRAHDPELRRDVALKIFDAQADADREELLREARVMAALGHPNVVAVHDAGVIEQRGKQRVFIAMELVTGGNLRAWLETPRPPAQVLAVLRDAGRGLAAAHAAGIVHRDLKPDNILVGDDGRPRVVDFGLARAHEETATSEAGTPAYMAPEQLAGAPATPASDQFAFCVTAWEALHGERPFAAHTLDELRAAHGRPPVAKRSLDGRVQRALVRGLAVDPAQRFATMDALLGELAPGRKKWPLVAALAVVAGGGVAIGVVATRGDAGDPCPPATTELAGVWDPAKQAAVERGFRASKLPYAEGALAQTTAALDRAAQGWLAAQHDACVATAVRHEQSPDLLDRRVACLRDWKRQLRALTDACTTPTPEVVQNAVRAVGDLPSLAYCADRDALAAGPPRPKDPHVDELYDQLAKARGLALSGPEGVTQAFAIADKIAKDPAAAKYAPLALAIAQWQAGALRTQNRYDDASAAARRAFDLAFGAGNKRAAAEAGVGVAALGMSDASKKDEALRWLQTASSLADKLDGATDLRAMIASAEGSIQLNAGDAVAAEAALLRAIAALRKLDANHAELARALTTLGISELRRGKVDPACEHLHDGLARTEAAFGKDHPEVATTLVNLAFAEAARGHFADAAPLSSRAIAILEKIYGANHPTLISMHGSLAQNAAMRGDRAEGAREYAKAIAIAEANFGADNPMIVPIRLFRADLLPPAESLPIATALRPQIAEEDDGDLGFAFADAIIAHGLEGTGKHAEALARARDAAKRCEAHPEPEPLGPCPMVFQTLGDLAHDVAALDHAQQLLLATPDPLRLAQVRLSLATLKKDKALAAQALREFPRDGDPALRTRLAAFAR